MADLGFEQLLAEHEEAFQQAEEFGSDWMPEDGRGYLVLVTAYNQGQAETKEKKPYAWARLTGHIENPTDAEQHGKDFCIGFYKSIIPGLIKGQARVANNGEPAESLEHAFQILENAVGSLFLVDVKTKKGKDDNEYTNAYLTTLVPVEAVEEGNDPAEPPQEGEVAPQDEAAADPETAE